MPNPENIKPHQFKPGQSGNPAGHSKQRRVTDALVKLLVKDKGRNSKELAEVWIKLAKSGDFKFFQMLLDRSEGPLQGSTKDGETTLADILRAAADYEESRQRKPE